MIPTIPEYLRDYGTPTLMPTKTFKIDFDNKRIYNKIDGIEAVKQAITLHTNTERYETPIFDESYGIEMNDLIGSHPNRAKLEAEYRIKDCLSIDKRVQDLTDFEIEIEGQEMKISYTVHTTEGTFETESVYRV